MGAALIALAMVAGCDRVFGLDRESGPPLDDANAAIDSPRPLAISDLKLEHPVAVGETAQITALVHGDPNELLPYTFAAVHGTVSVPQGVVQLDTMGEGMIATSYDAPAQPNGETVSAIAGGDPAVLSFPILAFTTEGQDTTLPDATGVGPSLLFAGRIDVDITGVVREVGLHVTTGGTLNVRLGLYANGAPHTLVAELAPQTLVNGRNVYAAPSVPIAPGIYWLAAVFSGSVTLRGQPTGLPNQALGKPQNSAAPMPATLDSGGLTMYSGTSYAYFLRAAYDPN